MFPILLHVGPITLYSFGLFTVLAIIVGIFTFWRQMKLWFGESEVILDIAILSIIAGFIGARLLFVILHPTQFWPDIGFIFDIFSHSGYVYYGALAGGIVAIVSFCRKKQIVSRKVFDQAAIATSIGHAIGLLGAFLSGTAFGAQTTLPWGVMMVGLTGKRHPVQLLECVLEIGIFLFLVKKSRRIYKEGTIALWYLLLYSAGRILIEFFRGDSVYWFGIKSMFVISGIVIILAVIYLKRRVSLQARI